MKDETAGVPIQELVTGDPKNYSYMLQTGDTQYKIRGFTLDEQGYELLNFESMTRQILAKIKNPEKERRPTTGPVTINCDTNRTTQKICLTHKVKKYGLVFDKNVAKTEDFSSRPNGYKWIREDIDLLLPL